MKSTQTLPPNHTSYYEVLGLPNDCTLKDIKLAYHKLLLTHHPDKQNQKNLSNDDNEKKANFSYSVQYIKDAYRTLSNEKERQNYDVLLHNHFIKLGLNSNNVHINGIDRIDLSKFEIIEKNSNSNSNSNNSDDDNNDNQIFFIHPCPRCSFNDGFILTEDDLEKGMIDNSTDSDHQILVQCASCSLWLCVTYSITN